VTRRMRWLDPTTGQAAEAASNEPIHFRPHAMRVLCVGQP
jgi:hypothetical protein